MRPESCSVGSNPVEMQVASIEDHPIARSRAEKAAKAAMRVVKSVSEPMTTIATPIVSRRCASPMNGRWASRRAPPASPVATIDEVAADPGTIARNRIIEQVHPAPGRAKLPNLPFRFSDCHATPRCPAPLMGQHNQAIAAELGFTEQDIAALKADGVLYAEDAVAALKEKALS
jgi:crotonobetainyl-CoA:carnitine CoA-transferase CaiB-like acyl-CoA transferase